HNATLVTRDRKIINYAKTREVFDGYKASKYSKKYLAEHEPDILLHRAAKKTFNDMGIQKLPTVKSLQEEYAKLLAEKKAAYADYRRARDEMRELLTHRANVDKILGTEEREAEKQKEHEQR
ncbi:MAG: relaxase, partial [Clostridia bacterium]|nr:relaxase [Clostridia bacterium]